MATEAPLILLVDSDSQWLEATSNYLFREGIDSLTATEGKKTLNILKKVTPHMILINIFLEDPDGVELCQQIRTLGTPSLIVLLAETHQEYALLAGFEAGADDFIYKDTKIKLLLYKIKAPHLTVFLSAPIHIVLSKKIRKYSFLRKNLSYFLFLPVSLIQYSLGKKLLKQYGIRSFPIVVL